MRLPFSIALALCLGSAGCILEDSSTRQAAEGSEEGGGGSGEPGDRDDCKIEGSDIGVQGLSIDLGSRTVTFESWVPKDDSPGEFVGFTLSLSSGDTISYLVKTGGEVYAGEGLSWSHPGGTSGPDAPAISYVDFCEEDDGDGGSDDGGGDDGECDPDVDTGSCDPGDGGGDGSGGGGDGGDGGGDDGECDPDVDTGSCDGGDGGDDGGVVVD